MDKDKTAANTGGEQEINDVLSQFSLKVKQENEGNRIDVFLAADSRVVSRNFAQRLIENGLVFVNKSRVGKNYRLQSEDMVDVSIPPPEASEIKAENISLDIRFEDKDLIILVKPVGMVVHPAYGHTGGTLVNALLGHTDKLSGIGGTSRPGIVHRLDKNTSGLMIVAKNDFSHQKLSEDLKSRTIKRTYKTLVHGRFKEKEGMIDAPIGRSPHFRQKMAVMGTSCREAVSHYMVLGIYGDHTLLEVRLQTGRTHQIRVHMKYINHPVVGDILYGTACGKRDLGLCRQFLHAYKLELEHPRTHEPLKFEDELPSDLRVVLDRLKRTFTKVKP